MTTRRSLRLAIVALVAGFGFLEALTWARLGALALLVGKFPTAAVTSDGTPLFYKWGSHSDLLHSRFDTWTLEGTSSGVRYLEPATYRWGEVDSREEESDSPARRSVMWTFGHEAFLSHAPFDDSLNVAAWLNWGSWRSYDYSIPSNLPPHATWSFASGQFLARTDDGGVRAVVGPGGAAPTLAEAGTVGRFGRLLRLERDVPSDNDTVELAHLLLDKDAWQVIEITQRSAQVPAGIVVKVHSIPVHPAVAGTAFAGERPFIVWSADSALAIDRRGSIWASVTTQPDAGPGHALAYLSDSSSAEPKWVLQLYNGLRLGDPLAAGTRIQRQVFGESALSTWDLVWRPTGSAQKWLAALACVPAVLRPSPLATTSFLSAAPTDDEGGSSWWWLDPVLAGQRRPIVLAANALLAALCAWLAWRIARVHCATASAAKATALVGLVLGPLGLLLIRLLVVRAPSERIGAGRRSLLLDTCPATDTLWSEPARTGREIIVEG